MDDCPEPRPRGGLSPRPRWSSSRRLDARGRRHACARWRTGSARTRGALGVQVDLEWVERLQPRGPRTQVLVLFRSLLTAAVVLLVGGLTRMALLERLPALHTCCACSARATAFSSRPSSTGAGLPRGGWAACYRAFSWWRCKAPDPSRSSGPGHGLPPHGRPDPAVGLVAVLAAPRRCWSGVARRRLALLLRALSVGLWVLGRLDRLRAPSTAP